jgi:fatty-acyl-CoA synthase
VASGPTGTILDVLDQERSGTVTFVAAEEESVEWSRLIDDALSVAAVLQARISPGAHVVALGETSRPFVSTLIGTWLAGATLTVLPHMGRGQTLEQFGARTRSLAAFVEPHLVVVDGEHAPIFESFPGPAVLSVDEPPLRALDGAPSRYDPPAVAPSDTAILQFTSGSTAAPKAVVIPHGHLCANVRAMGDAAGVTADDTLVSWLPLYHDMGLIGYLAQAMMLGAPLVLSSPRRFISNPRMWMQLLSQHRGTMTSAPNFAYALAARLLGKDRDDIDLGSLRLAFNGAEMIDPAAVTDFAEAAAPHGFDERAALCCYGLAEATLAVTFAAAGTGMAVDTVRRAALETGFAEPVSPDSPDARSFAVLGRTIPGLELRIVHPDDGRPLGEREVGEIEVRGNSVTPGYFGDPDATRRAFRDGWFRTGDLGYLVDGELVVSGRLKDLIIIGGHNINPEDIETTVESVEGVRRGNVVAFGIAPEHGDEQVVVMAETKADDTASLRSRVTDEVHRALGLSVAEVVIVDAGSLPKTPSGKRQRQLCRANYLEGRFQHS